MPDRPSPVRLQLGAELQSARTLAGYDQRALAARLGVSQALVSRAERGKRLLDRPTVTRWLREVKATAPVRERVLALSEGAHRDTRTWAEVLAEQNHLQERSKRQNAAATLVQLWQPTVLPGLLQTADYARHVIPLSDITGRIDHGAALAARIDRQNVLREPGRRFAFLIAERLLRWEPAPGVLGPQLAHLRAAVELDAVDLAVLPDDYAGALPWHNFVIRHPADDTEPPYVSVELVEGPHEVRDTDSVAVYLALWQRLWDAAVTGPDVASLLG